MIAEVVVNYKSKSVDSVFDYAVPEDMENTIQIGSCVTVPFGKGNRVFEAYVTAIKDSSKAKNLKQILKFSKDICLFDEKQLELIKWMRDKYLVTYLDAIHAVTPPGTGVNSEEWIILKKDSGVRGEVAAKIVRILTDNGAAMEVNRLMEFFDYNIRPAIARLIKDGVLETEYRDTQNIKDKTVRVAMLNFDSEDTPHIMKTLEKSNAAVQAKMIDILSECEFLSLSDLVHFANGSYSAVQSLKKKGLITTFDVTVTRNPFLNLPDKKTCAPKLTEEQERVIAQIAPSLSKKAYAPFLLHGVTGSGKTEVFMQIISEAISAGRQAIVLVPEISLTPQMISRFVSRFGNKIAVLHSGLSLGEKYDQWKRIKNGEADIVIGARSAVFAPLDNIGAIIIDEEHEQTYKSEMTPRYYTHEVAEFRARQYGSVLIFASATPLITSYYKAKNRQLQLLEMKNRYNKNIIPEVEIVDLRDELASGNKSIISRRLREEIAKNIENGQQTILFLNRRGFSTFVSCRSCGFVPTCPNCSISMTYHKFDNTLRCHYCGHSTPNYSVCPKCGSKYIRYFGGGTQKVEEEIHRLFPSATTLRMDIDTTAKKHAHEKILRRFAEENINILIGTQMVTKGLDFPNVTLVGVISADTLLNIDDYRSLERTFSILEQVTGRAGRSDKPGRSIIQTYSPDSRAIQLVKHHDYITFYNEELAARKAMWYPPFSEMISVIFSGTSENLVAQCSRFYARNLERLRELSQKTQVIGPIPAAISKIKNKYRYRIIIKCENADFISGILLDAQHMCAKNENYGDITIIIDKNPNSMG